MQFTALLTYFRQERFAFRCHNYPEFFKSTEVERQTKEEGSFLYFFRKIFGIPSQWRIWETVPTL